METTISFFSYLMLDPDLTLETFDGLFNYVKQSCRFNPSKCSSTDR